MCIRDRYNPLSFLNEDKIDKTPAVICQSFSFEAIIGGSRYELDVMENIDVPSGMGDYTITLTRDEIENYLKIEDALSFDCDRYECTPEEVAERFTDSPIVRLCNAIIPCLLYTSVSPAFYHTVYDALMKACFMEIAKLYDTSNGVVSIGDVYKRQAYAGSRL